MATRSEAREYGPHLVPHLGEPFLAKRDLAKEPLHAIQDLADWALLRARQWDIAVRVGSAVAIFSPKDLKSYKRDQGLGGRVARVIRDQRSQEGFLRRDKGSYLRLLVGRKLVFPDAPALPFDEELFSNVNRDLTYINNIAAEHPFWRVHLENAKNVALLYPEQRLDLAVDKSFYDLTVDQLALARASGNGEEVALIGSAVRILYPDRVSFVHRFNPQAWVDMKATHHNLVTLAARDTLLAQQRYEEEKEEAERARKEFKKEPPPPSGIYVRLAEHDANMAILGAKKISITPKKVKIELAA